MSPHHPSFSLLAIDYGWSALILSTLLYDSIVFFFQGLMMVDEDPDSLALEIKKV